MLFESTTVALTSCPEYSSAFLGPAVDRVITALGELEHPPGLQVVLKPNLISAKRGPLACTEGAFIVAVARWFLDKGARVCVGDSPAFGTATAVLDRLGVLEDLRYLGVSISDFTSTRKLRLHSGVRAAVAEDALDCDLLVNLPRVKAHAQTRVTLAVKNCFGCLAGLQKPWWHMVHGGASGPFADLLVELLAVLPRTLTLVDGIRAMHDTGPVRGNIYPLNVVAGGMNPVAVDTAVLSILNVDPRSSPLWRAAAAAEIPGSRLAELSFPLATPAEVQVSDFRVPDELNPIRFHPVSFAVSSVRRTLMVRKTRTR